MKSQLIQFTDTAEEELQRLYDELQISDVVSALRSGKLSAELQTLVVPLATTILDLFGKGTPTIGMDPISALKSASRDINLSRILRERGLFRLFRLLNTEDDKGQPFYKGLIDPNSGMEFTRCEDLVGWFCRSAKVSRSLVFMRMATIEKLLGLGFTIDQTYQTILTKPSAIHETLNEVGGWYKGELDFVQPSIALRLAEKYLPAEELNLVQKLAKMVSDVNASDYDRDDAENSLIEAVRPAISKLIEEVAVHEDLKGVMEFVRSDIAGKPEINYSYDYEHDELVCEVMVKAQKQGTEYIKDIVTIRFMPDRIVPRDLCRDITTRLPIKNRIREE